MSRFYQAGDAKGKGSFQAGDAAWSFGKRLGCSATLTAFFFFFAVRSMVSSDHINGTVF